MFLSNLTFTGDYLKYFQGIYLYDTLASSRNPYRRWIISLTHLRVTRRIVNFCTADNGRSENSTTLKGDVWCWLQFAGIISLCKCIFARWISFETLHWFISFIRIITIAPDISCSLFLKRAIIVLALCTWRFFSAYVHYSHQLAALHPLFLLINYVSVFVFYFTRLSNHYPWCNDDCIVPSVQWESIVFICWQGRMAAASLVDEINVYCSG